MASLTRSLVQAAAGLALLAAAALAHPPAARSAPNPDRSGLDRLQIDIHPDREDFAFAVALEDPMTRCNSVPADLV
jgi:hypothetical protein